MINKAKQVNAAKEHPKPMAHALPPQLHCARLVDTYGEPRNCKH